MSAPDWLTETRRSYDTVATSYAELFPDGLARHPHVRATLSMFAELVRDVGGPVLDVGCGTGLATGHLDHLGIEVSGIDLSPGMLEIARREHRHLRFELGSMTDLDVANSSVGGVLAFYSVIHVPDSELPAVFAHFHRVLRPGGIVMIGFHVGDADRFKTEGYGGHPMKLHVHLRPLDRVAAWLRDAGFVIEARVVLEPDEPVPGGVLIARRPLLGAR
jgi:SAM-dependent methyltransferase